MFIYFYFSAMFLKAYLNLSFMFSTFSKDWVFGWFYDIVGSAYLDLDYEVGLSILSCYLRGWLKKEGKSLSTAGLESFLKELWLLLLIPWLISESFCLKGCWEIRLPLMGKP